jgi:hypothetical protein
MQQTKQTNASQRLPQTMHARGLPGIAGTTTVESKYCPHTTTTSTDKDNLALSRIVACTTRPNGGGIATGSTNVAVCCASWIAPLRLLMQHDGTNQSAAKAMEKDPCLS